MLMTIQEYLNCWVEDAKALNVAKKGDIAKALGISPQQLTHLLKGRDDWRATYIDKLCAVTKQSFSWPLGEANSNRIRLNRMLDDLLDAGGKWSSTIQTNIESLHKDLAATRQESGEKTAVA
jgi:hypothetical protein